MVQQFFIFDATNKNNNSRLKLPLSEIQKRVEKTFDPDSLRWEISNSANLSFVTGFYKTLETEIKMEIFMRSNEDVATFQLTVLDGIRPFETLAILLYLNEWSALNLETNEYFDEEKLSSISITDKHRKKHNDEFWDKMNEAQEEIEQRKFDSNSKPGKWWEFWK